MPPKTLAKAGIVVAVLAVLVSWGTAHWLRTRTFDPLNMPVTLEAGKLQTAEFEINLREEYSILLTADYDQWSERECPVRLWDTDWKVYRLVGGAKKKRELWASSEEIRQQGAWPLGFHGVPGKYQLEWTVPSEAVCLNARHPNLSVRTDSRGYEEIGGLIQCACLFLLGTGVMLVFRALGQRLLGNLIERRPLRLFPGVVARNVLPLRRHPPLPLIRDLPNFGLVYGCILVVLLLLFLMNRPLPWRGLLVDFRQVNTLASQKSPWAETLGVYVDARGQFYVNGKIVPREKLRAELKEELNRRMVWTVYFEAHGNSIFAETTYAIDTIQGLGAKVAWITPRIRKELDRKAAQ